MLATAKPSWQSPQQAPEKNPKLKSCAVQGFCKFDEQQLLNMKIERVYAILFASVYPLYIKKAERKGRSKEEVDEIIYWLTGYDKKSLQQQIDKKSDLQTFFAEAPQLNSNVSKITGMICGYRVEEIEDKLMQKIRYMDKLVDELAKGKAMEKILRK